MTPFRMYLPQGRTGRRYPLHRPVLLLAALCGTVALPSAGSASPAALLGPKALTTLADGTSIINSDYMKFRYRGSFHSAKGLAAIEKKTGRSIGIGYDGSFALSHGYFPAFDSPGEFTVWYRAHRPNGIRSLLRRPATGKIEAACTNFASTNVGSKLYDTINCGGGLLNLAPDSSGNMPFGWNDRVDGFLFRVTNSPFIMPCSNAVENLILWRDGLNVTWMGTWISNINGLAINLPSTQRNQASAYNQVCG